VSDCQPTSFDIEIGRRINVPRDQRLCTHCKSGDVGDEFHTLFLCHNQNLSSLRKTAIENICYVTDSFRHLSEYCFLANEENICHVVGKYFGEVLGVIRKKIYL
jgi:hypothetical protein